MSLAKPSPKAFGLDFEAHLKFLVLNRCVVLLTNSACYCGWYQKGGCIPTNKCSTQQVARHSKHSRRSMQQKHRKARHCKWHWVMCFFFLWTISWVPKYESYEPCFNGHYEMSLKHIRMCSCTYNMSSACFQFQQPR